jgi:L-seryl-tRNA(Ser) seleniumtransferase
VINATGVILHTNLGRAPLSDAARQAMQTAAGYCSLEYDIAAGVRGRRGSKSEDVLIELTGSGAALIVNNCAAAALLVLSTLARDGETIVSRGELVEIGGDFRVPDVMAQSGTRMVEVGTTNRTGLIDYRKALSDQSRLVMRVHTSNYRIVGFTKTPTLSELAELAHSAGLPLYEDAGSGALIDLTTHGIGGEPVISGSLEAGADVVTFSGDKLLGGPQAGIIVGRSELIERMRANPLYRALRADKIRLAALEKTLEAYSRDEEVPVRRMIAMTATEIGERADRLIASTSKRLSAGLSLQKIEGESAVGGGSAPTSPLPTFLISVTSSSQTANEIENALRQSDPPIIVRIVDDRVLIDLRTVAESEEAEIQKALASL